MSQTWVFNSTLAFVSLSSTSINFTSNGESFSLIYSSIAEAPSPSGRTVLQQVQYGSTVVYSKSGTGGGSGWNLISSKYQTVTFDSPVDLTTTFGQWLNTNATLQPSGYTITYQTNGGTSISQQTEQTNLPNPLPTTTRSGYTFVGWYTDSSFTTQAIAGASISQDTTLYAKWIAVNKIIYNNNTLIDLTSDTAEESNVDSGYTFHKADGSLATGTSTKIQPSGNIDITTMNSTNVTNYATAKVVDSDLVATNIKKDVNILGVTGTYEPSLQTKSVTPTTSAQTITPDSSYDGLSSVSISAVTSSIDANIVAGNIKKDVAILGVTGTYEGSGGSDTLGSLINDTLTTYTNSSATTIPIYTFYQKTTLTSVTFSNVTSIGTDTFCGCTGLTSASFPNVSFINSNAFSGCTSLSEIYIGHNNANVCEGSYSMFNNSPNLAHIYVPNSLVNSYKNAPFWLEYTNIISGDTPITPRTVTLNVTDSEGAAACEINGSSYSLSSGTNTINNVETILLKNQASGAMTISNATGDFENGEYRDEIYIQMSQDSTCAIVFSV